MADRLFDRILGIRTGFVLLCGLIAGISGFSQPDIIRFDRLSDEEGLPSNEFKQIIQDRDGLLWMSGADGLARYDGYHIESFRHSHVDTTSISGNNISTIFEDSKGRLWVGMIGANLNVSNTRKNAFQRVRIFGDSIGYQDIRIADFTEDPSGRIWLATNHGLFILREENGVFIYDLDPKGQIQDPWGSGLKRPIKLYSGPDQKVWVGTNTGLFMYDPVTGKKYTPDDFEGLPTTLIQDIETDREGRLWISCQHADPRLYYASSGSFRFDPFRGIPVRSSAHGLLFTFDLDNRLWAMVFQEQAYGYDFRDSTLFLESTVNSDIPHERFFRKPFVDHSGNTWLPCEGFYIYPYPKGFQNYLHPLAFHQSSSFIYNEGDVLWLGYREKGFLRLDKASGSIEHFHSTAPPGFRIPVDHVQDIFRVRSGNHIIVGFSNVAVLNNSGKIISSHPVGGTNRGGFEDSAGRIWIGGISGLHLFSEAQGVLRTYTLPAQSGDARNFIQAFAEDKEGRIWFASDLKGLASLNPASGEIHQFLPVEGDNQSIPSIRVVDLAMDDGGALWLGTDVALVHFDPARRVFTSYGKNDGIANDYISSVICGRDGLIWVSTHSGVSSFNPETKKFVNYSAGDGLSNVSYYNRSKYYSEDGVIYFGGKNGVDYFHPDRLRINPVPPRMILSGIRLNQNQPLSLYDLSEHGTLEMSYQDDLLEIEITGLQYSAQNEVRYMYRLVGIHKDWIDLGQQRHILISGLKPGDYVFQAKAVSGDAVWSDPELELPIVVKPPVYGTVWFQIAAAVALLGALLLIMRYRERSITRKEKREAEVNRKISELEKRALQAQMNPHFIYNSMNSIQQFMIVHDIEGAMKYLTKFSRILRTVLNISSQSRVPLYDEIRLIEDYLELESMRFPNKFTYTIHIAPDINIHTVEIPPFFIQPQVENAIRHGLLEKSTQGQLRIEIMSEGPHLHIIVEDNGIGRDAARLAKHQNPILHESKGLAIVEERLGHVHLENGYTAFRITDLYDTADQPAGTRVEITLPLD